LPARLEDNPTLAEEDPLYEARLHGLGSEALVRAMRYGDWDVVDGAFFDCWSERLHVIEPFAIPDDWAKFRSGDWGSARPFSFGWWAIVGDDTRHPVTGVLLPRGAIIRYREWYGCEPGKPNKGLKLTAEQVGKGLAERETEKVGLGVLDPAAFAEDGGPSIASRITIGSGDKKIFFRHADNKRVSQRGAMGGWDIMRQRLIGTTLDEEGKPNPEGRPMIFCFSTCRDSIRTIPMLQHDEARPEDLDTEMEDHAADDWRYACMSRPWVRNKTAAETNRNRSGYSSRSDAAAPGDWQSY
ncbi:terminase, partial [Devosia sp. ZB163]|nr:terminase [Devosia sp. ZB163]